VCENKIQVIGGAVEGRDNVVLRAVLLVKLALNQRVIEIDLGCEMRSG